MSGFKLASNFRSSLHKSYLLFPPSISAIDRFVPALTTGAPFLKYQHPQLNRRLTRGARSSARGMSAATLLDLIKNRRSHYVLKGDLPISQQRVQEIVTEALLHSPSAFNSQSNRVILLFNQEHRRLWQIAKDILKQRITEEKWKRTEVKLRGFEAAAGTVLFFEDQATIKDYQQKFATYAGKLSEWAAHADGMLQLVVWTALEAEGLGANLQHYNPLIDEKIAAAWDVPANWKLHAQLVFGSKSAPADEKDFMPVEQRMKVFS